MSGRSSAVERHLAKVDVESSILFARSIFFPKINKTSVKGRYTDTMGKKKHTTEIILSKPLNHYDAGAIADAMQLLSETGPLGLIIQRKPFAAGEQRDYFHLQGPRKNFSDREFTTLIRGDISDDDLVAALTKLPRKYAWLKKDIAAGFNLPEPGKEHKKILAREKEAARMVQERMQALESVPPLSHQPDLVVSNKNSVTVAQGHHQTLKPKGKRQVLVTHGVAQCVAVIMRNPANGITSLAHLSCWEDLAQLDDMRKEVGATAKQPCDVMLWGGRQGVSEQLVTHIMNDIDAHADVMRLTAADVCNPGRKEKQIDSIAVSAGTADTRVETVRDMEALQGLRSVAGMLRDVYSDRLSDKPQGKGRRR